MLNVKRLAVFRAVVRAGSISAAARHLHVSQPAVTKTVRLLEEEVGLALFSRVSGRLVLTPEAEELMSGIERLFGSVGAVEQLAEEIWSTNSATSASRHLRFDPEYWPHFGSDFIRYEVMVLAARDHLVETDGHEFAREQQHRLLLDGLLAPTNLIGRDTAAAIG